MKKKLIKSQKKMFNYMKQKALAYEYEINISLESYSTDQDYYSERDFVDSNMGELLRSIQNSHVTYLGDFHTYDQNSRNLVRIIRNLLKNKKRFVIGLEMVHQKDQDYIRAYLDGYLTELEFLESIKYTESWRFPWNHYKVLFELAISHQIEIIALNSEGTLEERDESASGIIASFVENNPTVPILVLFGELHILPNKIPKLVKIELERLKIRQTIIHQNLDTPYWKIVDKNGDINNHKLVKFSDSEFCLFSSAPWMKYESMIYWYENVLGDPDFDIHEYIIEKGLKLFSENTNENFVHILEHLLEFLGLDDKEKIIEDFNLYDHSRLDFIDRHISKVETEVLKDHYQYLMSINRSFHIYDSSLIYCSNYSVNKLAWLSGTFIFQKYRRDKLKDTKIAKKLENASFYFQYNLVLNFFSYFCSKVVNPFLKCDLYLDLENKKKASRQSREKKVLQTAIDILCDFSNFESFLKDMNTKDIYKTSCIVSEVLADTYYDRLELTEKGFDASELEGKILGVKITKKNLIDFINKDVLVNNLFKMKRKRYF